MLCFEKLLREKQSTKKPVNVAILAEMDFNSICLLKNSLNSTILKIISSLYLATKCEVKNDLRKIGNGLASNC